MKRIIYFLILAGMVCLGASAQFSATIQKDYAMVLPAGITSLHFILYFENDSTAQIDFVTTDTTKTGVYDTIITLPPDSIGRWRAQWYCLLATGQLLSFSEYAENYIQDSALPAINDKTGYALAADGLDSDTSFAQIQAAITALRDTAQYLVTGGAGAVDSAMIEEIVLRQVESLLQKIGADSGMTVVYRWHADADSVWYINASGDTVRISEFIHTGGTAGQRPDTALETKP